MGGGNGDEGSRFLEKGKWWRERARGGTGREKGEIVSDFWTQVRLREGWGYKMCWKSVVSVGCAEGGYLQTDGWIC